MNWPLGDNVTFEADTISLNGVHGFSQVVSSKYVFEHDVWKSAVLTLLH